MYSRVERSGITSGLIWVIVVLVKSSCFWSTAHMRKIVFDSAVKQFNVWKVGQGKLVPPAILKMLRFAGYVVCKLAQDFFDSHSWI